MRDDGDLAVRRMCLGVFGENEIASYSFTEAKMKLTIRLYEVLSLSRIGTGYITNAKRNNVYYRAQYLSVSTLHT